MSVSEETDIFKKEFQIKVGEIECQTKKESRKLNKTALIH